MREYTYVTHAYLRPAAPSHHNSRHVDVRFRLRSAEPLSRERACIQGVFFLPVLPSHLFFFLSKLVACCLNAIFSSYNFYAIRHFEQISNTVRLKMNVESNSCVSTSLKLDLRLNSFIYNEADNPSFIAKDYKNACEFFDRDDSISRQKIHRGKQWRRLSDTLCMQLLSPSPEFSHLPPHDGSFSVFAYTSSPLRKEVRRFSLLTVSLALFPFPVMPFLRLFASKRTPVYLREGRFYFHSRTLDLQPGNRGCRSSRRRWGK